MKNANKTSEREENDWSFGSITLRQRTISHYFYTQYIYTCGSETRLWSVLVQCLRE